MIAGVYAKHESGLNSDIGPKVGKLVIDKNRFSIQTSFGSLLATIKAERIVNAVVVHMDAPGGKLKKTKSVPQLWLVYSLKDGSTKRLVFNLKGEAISQAFWSELIKVINRYHPKSLAEVQADVLDDEDYDEYEEENEDYDEDDEDDDDF